MVDFNKRIINSDKFRQAAIFFKEHGCYTLAPPGTTDYVRYWEQETQRCIYGYVSPDGDAISGYNYFYLNYFPILRLVKQEYKDKYGNTKVRRVRTLEFADFYDYDYYYFNAIEEAEEQGKHMVVLKARNKGYSFKGASMLVRNYALIRESQNFALASDKGYLTQDGLLTKAWAGMDFIDKHTAWAKQRLTATSMERKSGYKVKDEFGKEIEAGYKSAIIGKTLKDDPDKARGIRGKLILWEEAGNFKDILKAWQIARESVEEAGEQVGLMIAYGTGGTEGANFEGLEEMFYHPKGYNVYGMPNIWDEKAEDQECGFFVPAYANLSTLDKETQQRLYMDDDGNTLKEKSIAFCMNQRTAVRDGASNEITVDRFIAENPLTPQESILEIGGNIFPKKLLMQQLAKIRTNTKLQNLKHVVDLAWDGNGQVIATEKKSGDITQYPLKKEDKPEGSVVIWEYPITDPPYGLYIGGCLTPGEKVYTGRGLVNVEDVTLEDALYNKVGQLVPIKNIQMYDKVNEPTFRIKPYGSFRTTNFTGEHPIWTGNRGFVKAKDLTTEDWLEIPNKCYSNEEQYCWCRNNDERDLKFAYFCGLFTGDGFTNINGNSHDVYMSIGKDEKDLAQFYDKLVLDLFDRKCVHVHKQKEQSRRFTHKGLVEMLDKSIGIYACNKRVPQWVMNGSYGTKMAFLQGFMDADGSVFNDRGKIRVNFTSVNLELLEDIQDLLFGLQIRNSIVIHQKETTNKEGIHSLQSYRINIATCDNLKLIFDPVFESRKIKLLKTSKPTYNCKMNIKFFGKSVWLKIEDIKQSSYTGVVYNFECETHTFGCRCIMTHNCDPLNVSGV